MAQESWKMDKDETGCQPPEGLVFCANNCGFFGSATTMNLCSKCYRDLVLKQTRASKIASDVQMKDAAETLLKEAKLKKGEEIDHASSEDPRSLQPSDDGSASSTPILLQEPSHQPPNRCFTCNKRIGLTGFKCKCGNLFCSLHRYTDKHNCSYDYKKAAQDAIAKANPIVKAHKLDKI